MLTAAAPGSDVTRCPGSGARGLSVNRAPGPPPVSMPRAAPPPTAAVGSPRGPGLVLGLGSVLEEFSQHLLLALLSFRLDPSFALWAVCVQTARWPDTQPWLWPCQSHVPSPQRRRVLTRGHVW